MNSHLTQVITTMLSRNYPKCVVREHEFHDQDASCWKIYPNIISDPTLYGAITISGREMRQATDPESIIQLLKSRIIAFIDGIENESKSDSPLIEILKTVGENRQHE